MKYLVRHSGDNRPTSRAHIIHGEDTACKAWSTGSINRKRRWKILSHPAGRPVCCNCKGAESTLAVIERQRQREAESSLCDGVQYQAELALADERRLAYRLRDQL